MTAFDGLAEEVVELPDQGPGLLHGGLKRGLSGCLAHGVDPARSGKALPRHPVEPLSLAEVGETLHRPFDVAQTRFSLAGTRQ
jgi:hypothetical protein